MTEKEKMLRGELYNGMDAALIQERQQARVLVNRYNQLGDGYASEASTVLGQLCGTMGKDCVVEMPFRCDYGYNIHLGSGVFMNFNCVLLDVMPIHIGDRTLLGPGVQLYTARHPLDPLIRSQGLEDGKPITIEEDVWIGGNAVVLPGIRIGRGAVVGAGSVVTKDVPPMTVVAGNPAKFIKHVVNA